MVRKIYTLHMVPLFFVVENPQATGTNVIEGKKKTNFNKESSVRTKSQKKPLRRNVEKTEEVLLRRKRDPDYLNEENSNYELQNGSTNSQCRIHVFEQSV